MSNAKSYNLTTEQGRTNALEFIDKNDWVLMPIPSLYLAKKGFDFIKGKTATHESAAKEQEEIAINILREGAKQNLEEITITLERDAGIDLGAKIPGDLPVDLKFKVGADNKTTITARYRNPQLAT